MNLPKSSRTHPLSLVRFVSLELHTPQSKGTIISCPYERPARALQLKTAENRISAST
jgi:hypothetical protein